MGEPDRAETETLLREIGHTLRGVCPPGVGFFVSMFSLAPGWTTYASNARRSDAIKFLRELADQLASENT